MISSSPNFLPLSSSTSIKASIISLAFLARDPFLWFLLSSTMDWNMATRFFLALNAL
uniref:Uncharacterized protein n=1 Tax=Lotus japonicus TaxID=34305 RepID=I3SRV0_LOTJA|nr:unknown [Lotus japonicus]